MCYGRLTMQVQSCIGKKHQNWSRMPLTGPKDHFSNVVEVQNGENM